MSEVIERVCKELVDYAYLLPMGSGNGEVGPTSLTRSELRDRIVAMEKEAFRAAGAGELETLDMDANFPLRHIFAPGAYAREMTIRAGHWAIGKIHKHAHLSFITKGRIAVLTEDGPTVITAPYTFVNTPGTKRVVLALEDTVWTTVHITNKTDLTEIEDEVIAKSFEEIEVIEMEQKQRELP